MKLSKEQKVDIGRQLYNHEITREEAMEKYSCSTSSIDYSIQAFKKAMGIPTETKFTISHSEVPSEKRTQKQSSKKTQLVPDIETYMAMTKEELIDELIKAKANELRAKKGYEVKGDGVNKEFISLNNKNMK
jgi:transposase